LILRPKFVDVNGVYMKTKKAIELILMPKVFYTFKELRSNMSKTYDKL